MKFYNYINEQEFNQREQDIIEYLEDCKPFLKDWKKCNTDDLLMSGRKRMDNYFIGKVRKNRRPMNTKKEMHDKLDDLFNEKFGVKPRSNSLFCTAVYDVAGSYGDAFVIFPIEEYKIIWSKDVDDLFMRLGSSREHVNLDKIVDSYETGNLCEALNSDSEIMLLCDEYLALHTTAFRYPYEKNKIISMIYEVI